MSFQLSLDDIELPFDFKVLFIDSVRLLLLLIKLHPMPPLNVLLDLHSEDVSINWQLHLRLESLELPLLRFYHPSHISNSRFLVQLKVFPGIHFFGESLLILTALKFHILIMPFEVLI
mmetsp:Transcript_1236/g.1272  ORF Transcript_1236/g.1272 Transcript_1236/m.1272 type:complete len:118 (-) Transcript_1236:132-485(-)